MRAALSSVTVFLLGSCTAQITDYGGQGDPADDPGQDAAASPDPRDAGTAQGDAANEGSEPPPSAGTRDAGEPPLDDCSEMARWIYVVDRDDNLLRYQPDLNSLTVIGTLDCPGTASPFSMAVSRDAVAYLLQSDLKLYRVDIADASCEATNYRTDEVFEAFGMGFVASSSGPSPETLFIAGGSETGLGRSQLGTLDLATFAANPLGEVGGSAELTGNGNGELWGFFPDISPMLVRQLDKANGAALREFDVSTIDPNSSPQAWAFAFWGGRYYVFYQSTSDTSTSIYRLTPDTGRVQQVRAETGYQIVGAGVSICAPVILI